MLASFFMLAFSFRTVNAEDRAEAVEKFRWLSGGFLSDHATVEKIAQYLYQELGLPKERLKFDKAPYRQLFLVGVYGKFAIVFIRYDEFYAGWSFGDKNWISPSCGAFFRAFNVSLATGWVAPLTPREARMWDIRVRDSSTEGAPSIDLTYKTCWECEPETVEMRILFDPVMSIWRIEEGGSRIP